jgi:hypothetical protein
MLPCYLKSEMSRLSKARAPQGSRSRRVHIQESASDKAHMARRTLIYITSRGRVRERLGGTDLVPCVLGGTMRDPCWAIPCEMLGGAMRVPGRYHARCWAVPCECELLGGTMRVDGKYHAGGTMLGGWAVPCKRCHAMCWAVPCGVLGGALSGYNAGWGFMRSSRKADGASGRRRRGV